MSILSELRKKQIERRKIKKQKLAQVRKDAYEYWSDEDTKYILEAFNYCCAYCGSIDHIELDHFFPIKKGGKTKPGNLYPVCRHCNREKGKRDAKVYLVNKYGYTKGKQLFQFVLQKLREHAGYYG